MVPVHGGNSNRRSQRTRRRAKKWTYGATDATEPISTSPASLGKRLLRGVCASVVHSSESTPRTPWALHGNT